MTAVHARMWLRLSGVQRLIPLSTLVLVLGVVVAWLGIFEAVEVIVSTGPMPVDGVAPTLVPGRVARVHAPPVSEWSIPVDRVEFDAYNLALDRDDEKVLAVIETTA